jgi:electron transfer flavoprotein alpha/beta subunit
MVAIIDRDRLTAFGLALLLRDWGYDSVVGTTAGEVFGLTEAKGAAIAAIVADDRREDGITAGQEAAALAALARRTIPTVVLGGDEAEASGMAHVPKPIEPFRLRDLLETMVRLGP